MQVEMDMRGISFHSFMFGMREQIQGGEITFLRDAAECTGEILALESNRPAAFWKVGGAWGGIFGQVT